jgi:hypothetical protein
MADKNPCDHIEVFMESSIYELRDSMNLWLKSHPDFYIDQMTMTEKGGYYSVVCDLCLRDEEPEEEKKDLTEELLKGLIGAVNELTDAVKNIDRKTENSIM